MSSIFYIFFENILVKYEKYSYNYIGGIKIMNIFKELRKKRNLTQEKLAQKLNLTQTAISKWEKEIAFPDIMTLKKIADFFNVSVDYLLGNDTTLAQTNNGTVSPEDAKDIWFATLATDDQETINLYLMLDYADRLRVNGYILSKLSKATA